MNRSGNFDDHPLTIHDAAAGLRAGRWKPGDLVEQCLARIERFDPQVRAWVLVDDTGARRQAEAASAELAAGRDRGPLHGIPIGIKDIIDVAGFPTRAGSPLTSARPVLTDATIVSRLREAGAVILGKTVTTEFASFDPPVTRNPWNLERTPGGSSSGSAAALALGMCLGAIGSQTGGSITRPASYCGVAGLKPTYGRVSLAGIVPLAFGLDHPGPMARCVNDLAILLSVIAGPDPRDPLAEVVPVGEYTEAIARRTAPPRLGFVEHFFQQGADLSIQRAVERTLARLRENGAAVNIAELPASFDETVLMHRRLMTVGAADFHRRWFPQHRNEYGPKIASLLDEGLATSAVDYAEAVAHQQRFQREIAKALEPFDALIMPATPSTAPPRDSTGDPRFNSPWSYSGLPIASLPCCVAADGLPVAVQLAAPRFAEGPLLAAAAWCERALGFSAHPAMLG